MSTRVSIKWRERTTDKPGFHLYDDVLDEAVFDGVAEAPVYLWLDGVDAELETLSSGGALR